MDGDTPSKIDLRYAEQKVVFKLTDCSLDKKYSFWYGLDKELAKRFLSKLNDLEQLTWSQLAARDRKHGLSPERPGTPNFEMIHQQNSCPEKIAEQYYFHIRIEQTGLFRVFGYQNKNYFCITHIDPYGKINH